MKEASDEAGKRTQRPDVAARLRRFLDRGSGFDRAILLAVAVIAGAVWFLTLERVNFEYDHATSDAWRQTTNLAIAAEMQVESTMQDIEQTLGIIVRERQRHGRHSNLQDLFDQGAIATGLYHMFVIANEHGDFVSGSKTIAPTNVADRDYFRFHRANPGSTLFVGQPMAGRMTGQPIIPVTRRIDKADGSFGGVAIATIHPSYFADYFRKLDIGHSGTVGIIGLDGFARVRRIGDAIEYGRDMRTTHTFRALSTQPNGTLLAPGTLDGKRRYVSHRTLSRYPLAIQVAFPESQVLEDYYARRQTHHVAAWVGTFVLALVAVAFISAARRRRHAGRERLREEARFRAVFDQAAVGIARKSPDGRFLEVNGKLAEMLGYAPAELQTKTLADVTAPEDLAKARDALRQVVENPAASSVMESQYVRKDGSRGWMVRSLSPVCDASGKLEYCVSVVQDITERKRAEMALKQSLEQLEYRAHYDALTRLPNRVLFLDRLTQALNQAKRKGWNAGVLYLDLDRFKPINDTLGHDFGDQLLRLVAERLSAIVRTGDTVGRLGGDEFAVVLSELAQPPDAALVAQKVLDALAAPFELDGHDVYVTASVGIALYPGDGDDGERLLKNADAAMLSVKDLGKNSYQFYTTAMNERAVERLIMESNLRRALERDEFVLHLQPKASVETGAVVGCEALLRWQVPGNGLLLPAQFIPLLEESGLIVAVGEWVIRSACAQLRTWLDAGIAATPIAVNLSPKQFQHQNICAVVERALRDFAIDPALLELEITEGAAMHNADEAIVTLTRLKALGVRISIDDFGTGYSSLSYLKRFPVDCLKVDRSFVKDLPDDTDGGAIARAVINLAHSLGLDVVAEGVETNGQLAFLAAHGCDIAQGYHLSRPLPTGEFTRLLTGRQPMSQTVAPAGYKRDTPEPTCV